MDHHSSGGSQGWEWSLDGTGIFQGKVVVSVPSYLEEFSGGNYLQKQKKKSPNKCTNPFGINRMAKSFRYYLELIRLEVKGLVLLDCQDCPGLLTIATNMGVPWAIPT